MAHIPHFVDTKTIIVNLLRADENQFLSFDRLQNLLDYIYIELQKQNKLEDYQIMFDVYFDAIERTVSYNGDIFSLGIDNETIYLKDRSLLDMDLSSTTCVLDDTLKTIVNDFVRFAPLEVV